MDASRITFGAGRGCGSLRFSRRRRTTFSTSTIASSTTTPMAIARPPSVIAFNDAPNARSTRIAPSSESGMAVRLTSAVRH